MVEEAAKVEIIVIGICAEQTLMRPIDRRGIDLRPGPVLRLWGDGMRERGAGVGEPMGCEEHVLHG